MLCNACERQIGLPASWAGHARLLVQDAIALTHRSQTTRYACDACRTIFVRSLVRGWVIAVPDSPNAFGQEER